MTVRELIKELEKMPQEANINLFDWRKKKIKTENYETINKHKVHRSR